MSDNHSNEGPAIKVPGLRQRATLPLIIVAGLFIVVPFLAWYGTWFGRDLSNEKITEYLSDEKNPRHVQHALAQIAERLERKDPEVKRWYPQIVALSNSNITELRSNVAWLMGMDNQSEEFHAALKLLLNDKEPIVQRNAATALVAFSDASGLPVLRSMLQPFQLNAPVEGRVESILKEGVPIKIGMMLARIKGSDDQLVQVRSPLPGDLQKVFVSAESPIKAGEPLLLISPDNATVWEALRALYLVGESQDLPIVDRYVQGVDKLPEEIKKQAALTAKAIQSRSEKPQ